jgi:type IV secretion system protein VirB9
MRRWLGVAVLGVALGVGSELRAEQTPPPGKRDPRVRVIDYDAEQVVRLRGFVGYQIHLQFEDGEQFVNLAAGDMAALDVGSEGHHLMLKPKAEKVGTNLTLLTSRRVYHFDYSAVRQVVTPATPDVVYSLRFRYPEAPRSQGAVSTAATDDGPQTERVSAPVMINRAYRMCGRAALRPLAIHDDGVRTYFEFGPRAELPAIFVRGEEGESLVNYTVEAERIVVHRVAPAFTLRRGRTSACVINRAFGGGQGARLEHQTVLDGVERAVIGTTEGAAL